MWIRFKALIHIYLHAYKTACALDECLKALGKMTEAPKGMDHNLWTMHYKSRNAVISEGYKCLPSNCKWREDPLYGKLK